ncbi:MAG: hypothetical protein ACR652_02195 [Methylocystis sp.]|uniref:hypothetical protein n=1 Tax=Methylocystis sp. TaxID=1911079 RepID=UPI003DA67780
MTTFRAILAGSIAALTLASATTPASAGYYYRSGPSAGAIAGAAIGGMALGAAVGAMASQPRYYGYAYPAYGYGYGYPRYGAYGGYYGW